MINGVERKEAEILVISVVVIPELKDSGSTSNNTSTVTARTANMCLAYYLKAHDQH